MQVRAQSAGEFSSCRWLPPLFRYKSLVSVTLSSPCPSALLSVTVTRMARGIPFVISKFSAWWYGGGALSVFLPLIVFGSARIRLRNQQEYEEAQQQGGGGDDAGEQGYNTCRWWQWGCNSHYWDEDGNQDEQRNDNGEDRNELVPWWWFFATEEARRKREESQSNNPALVFVYVWSLSLFLVILYFGHRELRNGSDLFRVVACLVVFANMAFLSLFLIGGLGGVETGGRELEEQGFYSQFSVMMFLTNLCWMIFTFAFAMYFTLQARRSGVTKVFFEQADYQIHDDPTVETSPVSA
jgi:hypothetical protein